MNVPKPPYMRKKDNLDYFVEAVLDRMDTCNPFDSDCPESAMRKIFESELPAFFNIDIKEQPK